MKRRRRRNLGRRRRNCLLLLRLEKSLEATYTRTDPPPLCLGRTHTHGGELSTQVGSYLFFLGAFNGPRWLGSVLSWDFSRRAPVDRVAAPISFFSSSKNNQFFLFRFNPFWIHTSAPALTNDLTRHLAVLFKINLFNVCHPSTTCWINIWRLPRQCKL